MLLDEYKFTRPPLVMKANTSTGRTLRLITMHTKSKYVHNGRRLWEDPLRRQEFIEMALKARRRISAEALRIREYVDAIFAADAEAENRHYWRF